MTFRVIAELPDGTPLGGGPLQSVTRATVGTSVDRAGNVQFEMSATDSSAALFAVLPVYVRVKEFRNGTWVTAGRGIITQKSLTSAGKILQLSGMDLLDELNQTHVGTLPLTDDPGTPEDPMAAADVLAAIMAYALPGWTTTGVPSGDVYYQFGDETVLAALIKVADILGDHFRAVDRELQWKPTTAAGFDAAASGVRAVDKGEPEDLLDYPEICVLDGGLQVSSDDTQRATRIYPRGAGNAGARLYLNGTTWVAPTGYSLVIDTGDPAQSYIKHDANDATGVRSLVETFRDIAPLSESGVAEVSASDQLAVTAHKTLMRRLVPQKAYKMRVTGLKLPLLVGDTIHAKSRHVTDAYLWIDEGAELMINDTRSTYERGMAVHELDVTL